METNSIKPKNKLRIRNYSSLVDEPNKIDYNIGMVTL
jgi:hypothetical protein